MNTMTCLLRSDYSQSASSFSHSGEVDLKPPDLFRRNLAHKKQIHFSFLLIIIMYVSSCKQVHRFSEACVHLNSRSCRFLIFAHSTEPSLVAVMNDMLHPPTLLLLSDGAIESQM